MRSPARALPRAAEPSSLRSHRSQMRRGPTWALVDAWRACSATVPGAHTLRSLNSLGRKQLHQSLSSPYGYAKVTGARRCPPLCRVQAAAIPKIILREDTLSRQSRRLKEQQQQTREATRLSEQKRRQSIMLTTNLSDSTGLTG